MHVRAFKSIGWLAAMALMIAVATLPNTSTRAESGEDQAATPGKPTSFAQALDVLQQWIGPWKVTERHFDRLGKVVATTEGTEDGRWILDQHAIRRVYRSTRSATAYSAEGIFTWSAAEGRFKGVWFDNASQVGPGFVTAEWDANNRTMVFTVELSTGAGKTVTYRTVERFSDDEHRLATTYEVNGSELVKRIEVEYVRTVPCPERQSGMRIIPDGLDREAP